MTITQWHVPVDDAEQLLVRDLHELRRAGRQGRDARASGWSSTSCPTTRRARTGATTTASTRTSRSTTTYHGHGRGHQRARPVGGRGHGRDPGPHRASTSASPTRRSSPTGGCCGKRSTRRARRAAADGLGRSGRRRAYRARHDRRHRPDRRLAGLLAATPTPPSASAQAGQWTLAPMAPRLILGRGGRAGVA